MRKIVGIILICLFPLLLGTTYVVREDGAEVGKWTEDDGKDEVEYINRFASERPSDNVISLEEQGFKVTQEEKDRARKLWAQDQRLRKEIKDRINLEAKQVIVDTGQIQCYNNTSVIPYPQSGEPFFGQDAEYFINPPSYKDNGDGTVTDLNTGLMWSKAVDTNKVSLIEAEKVAPAMTLAGHSDWRVPNIKELYSLIDFRGYTGGAMPESEEAPSNAIPFINTDYFDFEYGQVSAGDRYIDAQWLTTTKYVSTTMDGAETLFGVNFADGRIKGYGYTLPGPSHREKKFYARYVRGKAYGENIFVDNEDDTITDKAAGLMWMQADSGRAMNWEEALAYAENLEFAGYDDWRLPSAKELQYLVDYTRSPDTTNSPAIDPVFQTTSMINEAGEKDYPCFWTSTTHLDGPEPGSSAAYVAFGRALGKMNGKVMDVHGAGSQRSDPKTGSAMFRGPQGDAVRSKNFVRCVRGGSVLVRTQQPPEDKNKYPYNLKGYESVGSSGRSARPSALLGRPSFVGRLDKDGDGKVSVTEFDGPRGAFSRHDRDGDGFLSEQEAPKGPPPPGKGPRPGARQETRRS